LWQEKELRRSAQRFHQYGRCRIHVPEAVSKPLQIPAAPWSSRILFSFFKLPLLSVRSRSAWQMPTPLKPASGAAATRSAKSSGLYSLSVAARPRPRRSSTKPAAPRLASSSRSRSRIFFCRSGPLSAPPRPRSQEKPLLPQETLPFFQSAEHAHTSRS
jgi:hypothetical protein